MGNLIRIFLFCCTMLSLTSCFTVFSQKQTEQLSRVVYATRDSIEASRIDLADSYSQETTRLVSPPKQKILIETIVDTKTKKRMAIVPDKYKNTEVIVVGSVRYDELLKDAETANQLKQDYNNLENEKQKVDEELRKKEALIAEMTVQVNTLNIKLSETSKALLKYKFVLLGTGVFVLFYFYVKLKNIFSK